MSMERYTTPEKVTIKNDKICLYLFVKALKVFVSKALRWNYTHKNAPILYINLKFSKSIWKSINK